ncbi:hypothetical protein EV702DRAFT_1272013 [Suillus placidus]|uniref:Uncharacterized protein n=1 Tax=Suillus placidus TaxID=48579 RepID=A0A9P6ZHQ1_9AGAM|nr:hypothetical protein EV702DRAFT_1272013 [Suillus placidus]
MSAVMLVESSQAQKAAKSYLLLFLDLMNLKVQVQLTNKKPTEGAVTCRYWRHNFRGCMVGARLQVGWNTFEVESGFTKGPLGVARFRGSRSTGSSLWKAGVISFAKRVCLAFTCQTPNHCLRELMFLVIYLRYSIARQIHKPCPPAREIQEPAQFYFKLNMSDVDLVRHLKNHYDQEEYGLSVISFRRMQNSWGWKRTRVLQVTESIMISGVLLVTSIQQPSALSSCLSILNMSMFSSMMYPRSAPLGLGFLCSCHHGPNNMPNCTKPHPLASPCTTCTLCYPPSLFLYSNFLLVTANSTKLLDVQTVLEDGVDLMVRRYLFQVVPRVLALRCGAHSCLLFEVQMFSGSYDLGDVLTWVRILLSSWRPADFGNHVCLRESGGTLYDFQRLLVFHSICAKPRSKLVCHSNEGFERRRHCASMAYSHLLLRFTPTTAD